MRTTALLTTCLVCSLYGYNQQSDFISFRKKERTIKTYFKGMPISFIHRNGSYINGIIENILNDSLFIKQYDVRMFATPWGTSAPDTVGHYDMRFHVREIGAIPRSPKPFEFVRNGTLLMIGGGGYAFLHTFNALTQKKTIYPATVAIAGGVAAIGFGLHKLRKHYYPIGKKYRIEYIKMKPKGSDSGTKYYPYPSRVSVRH